MIEPERIIPSKTIDVSDAMAEIKLSVNMLIKEIPPAKPSTPSMILKALIIPNIHKAEIILLNHKGNVKRPSIERGPE